MINEEIHDEDIVQRFVEEWERADCQHNGEVAFKNGRFRSSVGIKTLALLAKRVPEFDVHYVLTGNRTTSRLPEFEERILSRISKLDEDGRFELERALDKWLPANGGEKG